MGNCMKASRSRQLEEEEEGGGIEIEKACDGASKTGFEKENGKGSMKVKIVLTKEELEMFLVKLEKNKNGGGKSLRDLLAEMEQVRKHDSWRPSLESIIEDDPQGLQLMEDNY